MGLREVVVREYSLLGGRMVRGLGKEVLSTLSLGWDEVTGGSKTVEPRFPERAQPPSPEPPM